MSMLFRDLPGIMTHLFLFDREPLVEAVTLIRSSACVANVLSRLFWQATWPQEPWSAAAAAKPERRDRFAEAAANVYQALIVFPEFRDDLRQAVQPVADEMNARGLKFSIEPVSPQDLIVEGDKLGLLQARLWKVVGHLLLHDIALSEPIFASILEHAQHVSRGLLLHRVGFFRKEYHVGFIHHGDRDDLIQRARIRQPRFTEVGEILAAMHAASDSRHITYL
jgi:hypothetical protein